MDTINPEFSLIWQSSTLIPVRLPKIYCVIWKIEFLQLRFSHEVDAFKVINMIIILLLKRQKIVSELK